MITAALFSCQAVAPSLDPHFCHLPHLFACISLVCSNFSSSACSLFVHFSRNASVHLSLFIHHFLPFSTFLLLLWIVVSIGGKIIFFLECNKVKSKIRLCKFKMRCGPATSCRTRASFPQLIRTTAASHVHENLAGDGVTVKLGKVRA